MTGKDDKTFVCHICQRELPLSRQVMETGTCRYCHQPQRGTIDPNREEGNELTEFDPEEPNIFDENGQLRTPDRTDPKESQFDSDKSPSTPSQRTEPSSSTDSKAVSTGERQQTDSNTKPTTKVDSSSTDESTDGERETDDDAGREQLFFWDRSVESLPQIEDTNPAKSAKSSSADDTLDRKIDEWKSQCLDLTRRNKLVHFKPTKTKSLPLTEQDPTTVATALVENQELFIRKQLEGDEHETDDIDDLEGNEVRSTRGPDATDDSLYQVGLHHKQYLRERGVDTLYLGLGMLRWYSVDYSDDAMRSPLFLAPVELKDKAVQDQTRHNYLLKLKGGGLRLNPALRKKLQAEHRVALPADEALSLDRINAAFEAVYQAVRAYDRWSIQDDIILGIFDFTKFSIYNDLEENRESIKADPIVQALNDNPEPLQEAEGNITSPNAEELDAVVNPVDMYQVLDADSSQQEAIEAAKRGKSFVLQGPPGTGKSQTIANIIAEKLAEEETVLFVSEKQAALDVVKERLDDVGIGRFCLEAHGEKATNVDVLASLEDELKASRIKSATKREQRLQKLSERREKINQYGEYLFYSPSDWDLTVYQAFGIVGNHDDAPRVNIGTEEPLQFSEKTVRDAIDKLETLARFEEEIATYDSHPWRHTTLTEWGIDTGESMRRSIEQQQAVLKDIEEFCEQFHTRWDIRATSLAEFRCSRKILAHVVDRPDIRWQEVFFDDAFVGNSDQLKELAELEQDRRTLIDDLSENYERSFFSADGADLNSRLAGYGFLRFLKPSYRSLRSQILNHAVSDYDPGYERLLEDTRKLAELQRLEELRDDYQNLVDNLGPLYQGDDTDWETLTQVQDWLAEFKQFDTQFTEPFEKALLNHESLDVESLAQRARELDQEYQNAVSFFEDAIAVEKLFVAGQQWTETPFPTLQEKLSELHERVPKLQRWVQFSNQLDEVRETLCSRYVDNFITAGYTADKLVPAFKKRYYTKWLNAVYEQTGLDSFNVDKMERYLQEFRELDQEQQELAKVEIQHQVTNRRPTLDIEHASSSEQVIVRRETEKQSRHKPLRELFDEAGGFITQLTPCFMMSPLSVAQYLKTDAIEFDTVIFDEASQVMPEDAISSLIRADQAIIAGDSNQLPPTSFFQADVEAAEGVREDLDSILEEAASVMSEKYLRWHYRSRTEELIVFSNQQYYNGQLRTFPENEPEVETGVEFEYVSDGVYDRGGSRQNRNEAERVVDLVEEHAENHGEKSLGVVAFSSAQERAIREVLEQRRAENPVLNAFVSQDDVLEEFFIKNLEMVQGDERDRMIFSVGYGPDQAGTISMNFGPLNKDGGERRLNVAVTRAKEKVTVVSSLQPGDIDLTRTSSTGVEHFKKYLQYAKNGRQALTRDDRVTATLDFDSQFEEAVYSALDDRGFDVVSQVQSSSYSIDLAIKHPNRPGEFILGIECDGAAYHSSKTARDRDRIRQSVLEDLGWTIHRIWSPDWVSNKEREIWKIKQKIDSLLEGDDVDTQDDDIQSYEPEAIEEGAKTEHDEIDTYRNPSLSLKDRYSTDKYSHSRAVKHSLQDVVTQYGPIETEMAFRTALDVWSESRLGKNVQRTFEKTAEKLKRANKLYEKDGFLWPKYGELDFKIRINTDRAERDIDKIPVEEIAKAIALILDEGGRMTRDDLELETTRLFGYQRRGQRIRTRIQKAIDLLEDIDVLNEDGEKLDLSNEADVEGELLQRIYG